MRFDVLTLFPDMLQTTLQTSILKRATAAGHIEVHLHDIRSAATDNHKTVDDTPYGGGAGMVLKVDILHKALQEILQIPEVASIPNEERQTVLLCPQGKMFDQGSAKELSTNYRQITLICGHYEGFDERIRSYVDAELSIGPYVLTGGELPALVIIDAVSRLVPGVLHKDSPEEESFSLHDHDGRPLLEYPHYTRPLEYDTHKVPDILLSGNHAEIAKWRFEQATLRSKERHG